MSVFGDLLAGFGTVLEPRYLLFAMIGVTLGTFVGVLPGIGPALTIALLLPVTFSLDDPIGTFIMFAGIYYGAMYGGSTTSILLNTPGESASVATAIEGYQMARRGRARAALATAAIGSFVAGTISTLLLTLFAKPVAALAITFRAADYFALALLAMVAVTALVGRSLVRGLMSLSLGLFLGLVGLDGLTGQARFAFGTLELLEGIDVVVIIVGLFAIVTGPVSADPKPTGAKQTGADDGKQDGGGLLSAATPARGAVEEARGGPAGTTVVPRTALTARGRGLRGHARPPQSTQATRLLWAPAPSRARRPVVAARSVASYAGSSGRPS